MGFYGSAVMALVAAGIAVYLRAGSPIGPRQGESSSGHCMRVQCRWWTSHALAKRS